MALTLVFFVVAILAGLFGTPVGNRNFGIVFTWIVWWALLMLIMVPFAGRLWCSMCPIPAPGEWLQRRALVAPPNAKRAPLTLGRKWPRKLRNIWLQNGSFLLVALFSVPILTQPRLTGVVLASFIVVAIGTSLVYERRAFCRYLCPVGGFIGLYSTVAPLELRVKDHDICAGHSVKECYLGNDQGYGCPWLVFPGSLTENTYCGLCTECLKTCSLDNVALQLRPFGQDLAERKTNRPDEAAKAIIMLTCAFIYSVVLLGPAGALKNAANDVGSLRWIAYASAFVAANLLAVPGLFLGAAWLGKRLARLQSIPSRQLALEFATALIPLGLMAWIAFSLSFVFVNGNYALPVIADPFGWGWNLTGLAQTPWQPILPRVVPFLQIPLLIGGLLAALNLLVRTVRRRVVGPGAFKAVAPTLVLCTLVTSAFMVALLG
jgi:hypothetical protein